MDSEYKKRLIVREGSREKKASGFKTDATISSSSKAQPKCALLNTISSKINSVLRIPRPFFSLDISSDTTIPCNGIIMIITGNELRNSNSNCENIETDFPVNQCTYSFMYFLWAASRTCNHFCINKNSSHLSSDVVPSWLNAICHKRVQIIK